MAAGTTITGERMVPHPRTELVTFNLHDFPDSTLKPFDIAAVHPDDFLLDQLDLYPAVMLTCLDEQVNRYTAIGGPMTVAELLRPLERAGVPRFADKVRRHLPTL